MEFLAQIDPCPQGGFETGGYTQKNSTTNQYDVNGNLFNKIFNKKKYIKKSKSEITIQYLVDSVTKGYWLDLEA